MHDSWSRHAFRRRSAAALAAAACSTPATPHAAPPTPPTEESQYFVKELPTTTTARIEENGEKELRTLLRHYRHDTELTLEGEYAFAEGMQLDVEVPYVFYHGVGAPDDGVPAIDVGVRAGVLDDLRELAFSVGAGISAPVDEHQTDYQLRAYAARQLEAGDLPLELHASGGIKWDAHTTDYPWSVAAVTRCGELFPTLELSGIGNASTIAPGLVMHLGDDMEAAIAVPLRLNGDAESIGLALSFLIEW